MPSETKYPSLISGLFWGAWTVALLYIFDDRIGMFEPLLDIGTVLANGHLPDSFDWQTGFLIGLIVGAAAAALFAGDFKIRFLADASEGVAGALFKTVLGGVAGGFLLMSGMRLAEETVAGEIAGAIQLSGGSWLFLTAAAAAGIGLAHLLSRRGTLPDDGER